MKDNTHPNYYQDLQITCACGNIILAGSTRKDVKTELCSACHPFFTGKQKLLDTAGRVDKFNEKMKKMQAMKEKKESPKEEKTEESAASSTKKTIKKAAAKKKKKK